VLLQQRRSGGGRPELRGHRGVWRRAVVWRTGACAPGRRATNRILSGIVGLWMTVMRVSNKYFRKGWTMKHTKLNCTSCVALLVGLIFLPISCLAHDSVLRAKFGYDGVTDCEKPSIRNLPIRVEGTGTLSVDRHASLDVTGIAMGIFVKKEHYDTTLGGKPTAAENGAASVRVLGRRHLQAIRYYPNNIVIADLFVTGNSCVLKIDHRLKPGKRQYTFTNPLGGIAYCERPRTIRTSCEPI
jgi:hypothetical protein